MDEVAWDEQSNIAPAHSTQQKQSHLALPNGRDGLLCLLTGNGAQRNSPLHSNHKWNQKQIICFLLNLFIAWALFLRRVMEFLWFAFFCLLWIMGRAPPNAPQKRDKQEEQTKWKDWWAALLMNFSCFVGSCLWGVMGGAPRHSSAQRRRQPKAKQEEWINEAERINGKEWMEFSCWEENGMNGCLWVGFAEKKQWNQPLLLPFVWLFWNENLWFEWKKANKEEEGRLGRCAVVAASPINSIQSNQFSQSLLQRWKQKRWRIVVFHFNLIY